MNTVLLDELVALVNKQNLRVLNVVVRQNGELMARHDFEEEQPHLLYSASKTFTSMAVGIAVHEGNFKLDDLVVDFFPDYFHTCSNNTEFLKRITIHHLLCMGSGHAECPVNKADWRSGQKWDIAELFFEEPVVFEPGTHFTYDNSATYMLSRIISSTTGANLDDYLYEKIFHPLDIPKPEWDRCPLGFPQGFSGLHLTAEYLSRFGQLLLNKGAWNGQQLIPSGYVEQATSVQIKTDDFTPDFATPDYHQGYGYQLWMNSYPNSYRLDGMYGQYVIMLPDKNAVVTYVSNEPNKMTAIIELTWNTLVDKL
ncbi:serine hydrolase [Paenibacillus sp. FSL R7-0312]|uniref:serine hydrolase domain-containing protein n=1 Tax=unclassified Paenibacillus TaxID=185978 RepID=UPI0004F9203D|nr:serine hydrolase [Paenibacillus sp. FSL R5-0912]AIQ41029.1 beta-lactamase [Paenibacillus sp. FSL R5-0912]